MEAPPGIGPGMKVLQTSALPLGYGAEYVALVKYHTIIQHNLVFVKRFSESFLSFFGQHSRLSGA